MKEILNRTDAENQIFSFFNGKHFRFTSVEDPPLVIFRRSQNGSIVEHSGICFEIINALSEFYKFSYEVVIPSDGEYGTKAVNGSWNGMIAMILSNEADMGVAPFSVTQERKEVVQFTEIYYEEPNALLIPLPMEESKLMAFTKPFHSLVWLGLCLLMILLPLVLWLITEIRTRYKRRPYKQHQHCSLSCPKIVQTFQSVFAVLVSQPVPQFSYYYNWTIKSTLIMTVWCLSTMVLVNAYTGVMMSLISVPKVHPLVKSLDELPNSHLQWVVRRGVALEYLFMEAKGGIYSAIGNGLREHPEWWVNEPMEGVSAVIAGKSAYIDGRPYLEHWMKQDFSESGKCRLSTSKEEFFKTNVAFVAAKSSPLATIFNRKILLMSESGLIQHWKQIHSPSIKQCKDTQQRNVMERSTKSEPKKLSLTHLQSSFFILSIGALLALMTFSVELILASILTRITR